MLMVWSCRKTVAAAGCRVKTLGLLFNGTCILPHFKQFLYPHPRASHISTGDGRKAQLAVNISATSARPLGLSTTV